MTARRRTRVEPAPSETADDQVAEMGVESFPASDPPATWAGEDPPTGEDQPDDGGLASSRGD